MSSHNLHENSQARFCQLDTTTAEKPAGEKTECTPTGTERARQEKTCTSPLKPHTKESLEEARLDWNLFPVDAQSIKDTETAPSTTPEGGEDRRPTIPVHKSAVASPKAREIAVTRRSGPDHAEVPPMKEQPAVGGRKPEP